MYQLDPFPSLGSEEHNTSSSVYLLALQRFNEDITTTTMITGITKITGISGIRKRLQILK